MTFSSPIFLFIFFPLVFLCYFLIPAKFLRVRNALLTIASLVFYGFGEPVAMLLMLGVVLWSWGTSLLIQKGQIFRRIFLPLGILGDLGVLCVYKYADFLIESVNSCLGTAIPGLQLRLPIGISFFVFQAISYIMDVSRGDAKAQRNYFRLLLYIAFFPQLIAGPIVRYQTVEEALSARSSAPEQVASGIRRMIVGLSKKLLIADTVGLIADTVFGMTDTLALPTAWLGAFCYTLQIYYDFSGYSDMAIGMGRIFGFSFPENFNYPYCSASITEFWRRWHISLTTWFREYLYIPLGGNRKGRGRTVLNKWIVFLCTGLWHGASWTFVLWGAVNGLLMNIEELLRRGKKTEAKPHWYLHLYTILAVVLAFVIFRADTVSQAFRFYQCMFTGKNLSGAALSACTQLLSPLAVTVIVLALIGATPLPKKLAEKAQAAAPTPAEAVCSVLSLALLLLCVMSAAATTYHPFIYFRF
ncbi:MAG: MBOAT family protein [Oscillospiraceae bacterium]|nr:MBOAT family protein [Oscillospiraceae bacterium]